MNYQVLARKWRPKKFSDIVGQNHIIKAITHSFALNKIHQAYILTGTRGIGKTTIARLFAKGLNCEQGSTSNMCGQCNNCQDIELGCFIDLIEIDAASRTKVEDTREFLNNVQYMPSRGRFKVYLIDEVHMLSRHSFNALLKTLEEPPTHVKFILITTEYQKLPATILSRCLQFFLKPLSISHIITQLTYIFDQEKIKIESSALEILARASKGSMRDALSLAEQAIVLGNNEITNNVINDMFGILNIEHPLSLIESLINGSIHDIMHQIENYDSLGIDWDNLLSEMLVILQKIAVSQFLLNSIKKENNDNNTIQHINQRILKLSNNITPENVQLYYQIFLLGRRELPYTPNYRMGIEMTMLRAFAFRPDANTTNKKHNKDDNSISENFICSNNNPILNTNDKQSTVIDGIERKNDNQDKNLSNVTDQNKINDMLCLNLKESNNNTNNTKSKSPKPMSNIDDINITSKILEARSKLLQYKENNKSNKIEKTSDLNPKSQRTIKSILDRFSNINTNVTQNNSNNIGKINKDLLDSSEYNKSDSNKKDYSNKNHQNMSNFIKEILQQVMRNDSWTSQIYQLKLPKTAKKLAMNSWKEKISSNEICLHVRANYQHLNSTKLHNTIQKSLSNNIGIPITLYIKTDDNYDIKTPTEHIYILYKEKISKIKQEFSTDPYIKMIKTFFDAEIDENEIKVI